MTILLNQLIGSEGVYLQGDGDLSVAGVTMDSRSVEKDSLFIAVPGENFDGHNFLAQAVQRGARSLLVEKETPELNELLKVYPSLNVIRVKSTRALLAPIAVRFYGDPSRSIRVIGVTGTNGKTSTTFLIESILNQAGERCAVMGTVGYWLGEEKQEAPNTTPDPLTLQAFLRRAVDAGYTHAAMEVSSHALALGRVEGVRFSSCVFTNLTQEHLDFHGDMENYFLTKRELFQRTQGQSGLWGAVNIDDPFGARLAADYAEQTVAYGFSEPAALRAVDLVLSPTETRFALVYEDQRQRVNLPLLGETSAYNALAAAAAGLLEGIDLKTIAAGLAQVHPPRGRFERVDQGQDFTVIVDYAHTSDALERLLMSARKLNPRRIITVFGCGGDRDRSKRAPMGAAASRLSDQIFVTSDNPRTEDPEQILDEIFVGIRNAVPVRRVADRREAIRAALAEARTGDLVVVAGKGHEDYQILGNTKIHFDDREEVIAALHDLGWR